MNILIVNNSQIPAINYGGTERVIWYLGKELRKMGHNVTYLVYSGSHCPFAKVLFIDRSKDIAEQIPPSIDVVHFNSPPDSTVAEPYIATIHGNINNLRELDQNCVFVSKNHAERYGSDQYVHNGLDWDDYSKPDLNKPRDYFHFLGNASWRVKNVKGAIDVVKATAHEKLKVLGGHRLNFKMGFRLTLSPRVSFAGMVGGDKKNNLLQHSKGLIFPVRWHEPFGLAIIESLFMGCPVFGTPYGSLPELVPKDVGFLSNSRVELATEIQQVDSYDRMKCHQYASDVFNSKIMAEAYLSKYELVLNNHSLNTQKPKLIQQTPKFLEWS